MTIRWLPRRTATAAKVPTTTDLVDGEIGVNTTDKKIYIRVGAAIVELFKSLTKADVGLSNVDNTSDADKPVSTAQQAALDEKAALASPAFTGTPTVPTAALNTNTIQAASTAYVLAAIADDAPTKTGGGASGAWGISITGSAATLTTARTINGTSFNGSANITTANWGTARTLTIGSTGKSVNGAANVSWTLAELGAVANGGSVATIVKLTQAAYDALGTKDANTLYVIVG